jgi:hypothetical protein
MTTIPAEIPNFIANVLATILINVGLSRSGKDGDSASSSYWPVCHSRNILGGSIDSTFHVHAHLTLTLLFQESGVDIPPELRAEFVDLHRILTALRTQDIGPALECVYSAFLFVKSC